MRSLKRVCAAIFLAAAVAGIAAAQDLPRPVIKVVRLEDKVNNGYRVRTFEMEITNRGEFAAELFAPSPDLPPCGKNANSARTWINIYNENGTRLYGFCAIKTIEDLASLRFNLPADIKQPDKIYIDLIDRREQRMARSEKVNIEGQ